MIGSIDIAVQNARIKYELTIRRNITVIRGDSATGKTTLIDMIRDYKNLGEESGVELFCKRDCVVIEGNDWKNQLLHVEQSVVFIDEGNRFVSTVDFAGYIQNTDNYYVLVTREGISTLPYSVEEIYGIRSRGKYGGLKPLYHEMYRLYTNEKYRNNIAPTKIITEDSNAGYQFFSEVCKESGITCVSASGKSNICTELLKNQDENILVIADGAAFGSEMEKIDRLIRDKGHITVYLPESFEWLILVSDVLDDKEVREMSEHWEDFIESSIFFSWERFFTDLLIQKSQDNYLRYNKKSLNKAYLGEPVKKKILRKIIWWRN